MFDIALNTSTLRNRDLDLKEKVDIAAKAGYKGIEPWIKELQLHQDKGGNLSDIRQRIEDAGLTVVGAIGFIPWGADDEGERARSWQQAKQEADLVRRIGGTRMAAPPCGDLGDPSLDKMARRFADLLDAVTDTGVTFDLELWGFAKRLFNLSELLYIAAAVVPRKVSVLLDTYQIYRGGGGFEALSLLNGKIIGGWHGNDYPKNPGRTDITDKDRVFPGDGVAPLNYIYSTLNKIGFKGHISLELFMKDYGCNDPLEVARLGYEKTKEPSRRR